MTLINHSRLLLLHVPLTTEKEIKLYFKNKKLPFNSGKWQNALQVISIRSRFTVITASVLKRADTLSRIQIAEKTNRPKN